MLKKQIMFLQNDINDKNNVKIKEKKNNNIDSNIKYYDDDNDNQNIIVENPKLKGLNLRGGIIWDTNNFSTPNNIGNPVDDISISDSIIP